MKKEIFIIDDDPIYKIIVSKIIHLIDRTLPITHCENGEVGLTKLENIKNATHKIIVILDINMPILDGWGFLEKIQKLNFYNLSTIKIFLVSSSTDESDLLKASKFPFLKDFLHKPLSKDVIIGIINCT